MFHIGVSFLYHELLECVALAGIFVGIFWCIEGTESWFQLNSFSSFQLLFDYLVELESENSWIWIQTLGCGFKLGYGLGLSFSSSSFLLHINSIYKNSSFLALLYLSRIGNQLMDQLIYHIIVSSLNKNSPFPFPIKQRYYE